MGNETVGCIIGRCFDRLATCHSDDLNEATAASKILHIIYPDLFLMWDRAIRCGYGGYERIHYADFLRRMQRLANLAVEQVKAHERHHSDETAVASLTGCKHTLAKTLDEYNFVKFTRNDGSIWKKEYELIGDSAMRYLVFSTALCSLALAAVLTACGDDPTPTPQPAAPTPPSAPVTPIPAAATPTPEPASQPWQAFPSTLDGYTRLVEQDPAGLESLIDENIATLNEVTKKDASASAAYVKRGAAPRDVVCIHKCVTDRRGKPTGAGG